MANLRAVPDTAMSQPDLEQVVRTVLVGAVQFGYITIRYEHGNPTCVERFEQTRLTGHQAKP